MIHELRIENFYAIREEVVLDLRVGESAPDHPGIVRSWSTPNVRLPTVVAVVGPNASGKSTLLRALTAVVAFVSHSSNLEPRAKIPKFKAHLNEQSMVKPIRISVVFDANWMMDPDELDEEAVQDLPPDAPFGHLFRYELELNSDRHGAATSVKREALYYYPKGRPKRIFERVDGSPYFLGKEMDIRADDARLNAVRANASVVSTLAKLNHPLMNRAWEELRSLQSNLWSYGRSEIDTEQLLDFFRRFPGVLEESKRDLRRIDVGIRDVELFEPQGARPILLFHHESLSIPIPLQEESSGTRGFIRMYPALRFVLETGHIGVFDEFDADLHPALVAEIISWFHTEERNRLRGQIFVTMHNVAALDELEKEEVFFAQKSKDGATTVYGAQDIKGLRRDVSLENKYRSGALGALPNIG